MQEGKKLFEETKTKKHQNVSNDVLISENTSKKRLTAFKENSTKKLSKNKKLLPEKF